MSARPPPKSVWNVYSKFFLICSKVTSNCFCEVWLISSIAAMSSTLARVRSSHWVFRKSWRCLSSEYSSMATRLTAPMPPIRWRSASASALTASQSVDSRAARSASPGCSGALLARPPDDRLRILLLVKVERPETLRLVVGVPEHLLPGDGRDVDLELARHLLAHEDGPLARLGVPDLVGAQLLVRGVGLLAERGLRRLERLDVALDAQELHADLLDLLLRHEERVADARGARALVPLLRLKLRHLAGPGLDLLLALDEKFTDLLAAALHLAQAAVKDLDLLPALGEFEARLRQRLALSVTLGAHRHQAGLYVLDPLALGRRGRLRLGEPRLRLLEARLRLEPGGVDGGELLLHPPGARRGLVGRTPGALLLGLGRGEGLSHGHDRGPPLLQKLLGRRNPRVQGLALRPELVVRALVLREGPARLAQVDLALHDAVRVLLRVGVTAGHDAAAVHHLALAGRHREEGKVRGPRQKSRNAPRSSAM